MASSLIVVPMWVKGLRHFTYLDVEVCVRIRTVKVDACRRDRRR